MTPGRQYVPKLGTKEVTTTITSIKYREDINTGTHLVAKMLELKEIPCVHVSTSATIVFQPYNKSRVLGGFILIDKFTFETVEAGMLEFALRRANNIHW